MKKVESLLVRLLFNLPDKRQSAVNILSSKPTFRTCYPSKPLEYNDWTDYIATMSQKVHRNGYVEYIK